MNDTPAPPPSWGSDDLTAFLDAARHNQWSTFARNPIVAAKLIPIDTLFALVSRDWVNPQQSLLSVNLFFRCHAAFRAACGLAMAGQAAEIFVQCRSMIEYAAYAVHVVRNAGLGQIWLDRHKSPTAKQLQKKKFANARVLESVKAANKHAGERYKNLYELTIDFGAHPNERAVRTNMRAAENADLQRAIAIMQHREGPELENALRTVAQSGMISLEVLQIVFNSRFEVLGVNAALLDLRDGL